MNAAEIIPKLAFLPPARTGRAELGIALSLVYTFVLARQTSGWTLFAHKLWVGWFIPFHQNLPGIRVRRMRKPKRCYPNGTQPYENEELLETGDE